MRIIKLLLFLSLLSVSSCGDIVEGIFVVHSYIEYQKDVEKGNREYKRLKQESEAASKPSP